MSKEESKLLIENKQLAVKMLCDNLAKGNVVIDYIEAIKRFELPSFMKLNDLIVKWRAIYDEGVYSDIAAFSAITNEIFLLLLQGRIIGWITGRFEE